MKKIILLLFVASTFLVNAQETKSIDLPMKYYDYLVKLRSTKWFKEPLDIPIKVTEQNDTYSFTSGKLIYTFSSKYPFDSVLEINPIGDYDKMYIVYYYGKDLHCTEFSFPNETRESLWILKNDTKRNIGGQELKK